jgi:hypothetical protein
MNDHMVLELLERRHPFSFPYPFFLSHLPSFLTPLPSLHRFLCPLIFLFEQCSLDPLGSWLDPHLFHDGLCWSWGLSTIPHPFWLPLSILLNFQGLQIYCYLIWKVPLEMILLAKSPWVEDFCTYLQPTWIHYQCLIIALRGGDPLDFLIVFDKMSINVTRIALKRKLLIIKGLLMTLPIQVDLQSL